MDIRNPIEQVAGANRDLTTSAQDRLRGTPECRAPRSEANAPRRVWRLALFLFGAGACLPQRDLDAAVGQGAAGNWGGGPPVGLDSGDWDATGLDAGAQSSLGGDATGLSEGATAGSAADGGGASEETDSSWNPAAGSGGQDGGGAGGASDPGDSAAGDETAPGSDGGTPACTDIGGGSTCDSQNPGDLAPDLPDLPDAGVAGQILLSPEATWVIQETKMPTVEVHTPTASYWLVKEAGALVSISDSSNHQWIGFNAYRPRRGVPALGACCEAGNPAVSGLPSMTTVLDQESLSKTHVRLTSTSADGAHHLVWDFYLTHVTITVNRTKTPFAFTYRGVPGGVLDDKDRLVLSNGVAQSASNAWTGELPGPDEWVYFSDPAIGQSLFFIRHGDDSVTETYQVADQDSAKFVFGGGQLTSLPIRFSIGLIASANHDVVAERVRFITRSIH